MKEIKRRLCLIGRQARWLLAFMKGGPASRGEKARQLWREVRRVA